MAVMKYQRLKMKKMLKLTARGFLNFERLNP